MRFKLTKKFKEYIKINRNKILLKDSGLKWTIKNIIYNNISIDKGDLSYLCSILDVDQKKFNLKTINFNKQKNLGEYSLAKKIKFNNSKIELAEFVGILLGDGNIRGNNIRITIDQREIQYKAYIKELFYNLFNLKLNEFKEKKTNALTLYKHNKNLVNFLIKYGLKKGNKIRNNSSVPNWIKRNGKYGANCLKGLIDTDGCVYRCKRDKKVYLKYTSASLILINDVRNIAKYININFVNAGKNNLALYRHKEIARFINGVGFSNKKHIDRMGL